MIQRAGRTRLWHIREHKVWAWKWESYASYKLDLPAKVVASVARDFLSVGC